MSASWGRQDGAGGRASSRLGVGSAVALAACLTLSLGLSGPAAGEPDAEASAKRSARCKPPLTPRERRDCRDRRIGRPQNPRRQRYDGKRIRTKSSARCDLLNRAVCLQPWPNDYFTTAASTPTGRRINLHPRSMPANRDGARIDPTDYNRADGFSPGQLIVVRVPGLANALALSRTRPVRLSNLHAYTRKRSPIVVINTATGRRHPIWVELDTRAPNPASTNLEIRPAVNFEEGGHYVVAMRNLKNRRGKRIRPKKLFRLYRDRLITRQQAIERRRRKFERIFRQLRRAGIRRGNLYLAWDFTIASEGSLAGRALAMRNAAFSELGDTNLGNNTIEGAAPSFTVDPPLAAVDCTGPCDQPNEADDSLRVIHGTIEVPCYLSHPTDTDECAPGAQFAFSGPNDLTPNRLGTATTDVPFRCTIPDSVVDGGAIEEADPTIVGHGLLGSREFVNQTAGGGNEHNFVQCAMNWDGFSEDDLLTGIGPTLINLSNFPKIADGVQQAFVNKLYLGRALRHPDGFVDHEAFQVDPAAPGDTNPAPADSDPVFDNDTLFYWGVSHGGIMGGSLTALGPDHRRAVLNVPATNHSTLLERSIHWDNFGAVFYDNYTRPIEHPQILSMIQMLWDRAENNGYAHHITSDPYADTPSHEVLLQVSYGDHQVTNYAAEVLARTIGARVLTPALDPGLHWDVDPFLGIPPIASLPYSGSALAYWYGGPPSFFGTSGQGTAKPPLNNIPNRASAGAGGDPHGYVLLDPEGREQLAEYLRGQLSGCGDGGDPDLLPDPPPCYSNGYSP